MCPKTVQMTLESDSTANAIQLKGDYLPKGRNKKWEVMSTCTI